MQIINRNANDDKVVIQWSKAAPKITRSKPVLYLFDNKNKIFFESKELSKLTGKHQLVRENDTQLYLTRKFMNVRQKKLTMFENESFGFEETPYSKCGIPHKGSISFSMDRRTGPSRISND
jgi:hypothetical protein